MGKYLSIIGLILFAISVILKRYNLTGDFITGVSFGSTIAFQLIGLVLTSKGI